jgi:beta-galactosidase
MRTSIIFKMIVILFIWQGNGFAQNPVFPDHDLFSTGVYYYPEHWPREQWERDFKNMADFGFEFTHFAEFAWSFIEPEEGVFDFEWLDKAVELAHKHGLEVIMCTPTPTPPAWLTTKHPEVLIKNSQGHRAVHGTRQQASWSSDIYRKYVERVVERLGERYGNDPRIIGWQLDNEPSHYGWNEDYSEAAHQRFREWARKKYGTVENLNKEWGLAFWSQVYNNFDQIAIPNESLSPIDFINPHALLDWKRFTADEAADFLEMQTRILRKYTKDQWITTNYMGSYMPVDPWRSEFLDYISWTAYPVSGYGEGIGREGFRRGDPFSIGFASDRFRPYSNGVTGVMEIQISQVCWGNYSPRLYPGMRKVFLYHVLSGGNSFACFYRYRQPTFNYEQDILGIVGTDGVTLTDGGEEIVEFMEEIRLLRKKLSGSGATAPREYTARKAAILWNNDQYWVTGHQTHTNQWDYISHVKAYYDILKSFGCPVDFISEDMDFSQYAVLVVPAYELASGRLVQKWEEYARQGGQLLLTCRTAVKDMMGHYPETKRAGMISDLIGAQVEFFDNLPPNQHALVSYNNREFRWNTWGEVLTPGSANSIATHADQFYSGRTAITRKDYGRGSVTYIGINSDDKSLERSVLQDVFKKAGIATENYPPGIIVDWVNGIWVGVNYSDQVYDLAGGRKKEFIFGNSKLPVAGRAVWIER